MIDPQSREAGLALERLLLVRRPLAALPLLLRLLFREIFGHFRICDGSRDNATAAHPTPNDYAIIVCFARSAAFWRRARV